MLEYRSEMVEVKEKKWLEPDWRALVGRDLEQDEGNVVYRGPIKRVEVREQGQSGEEYQWLLIFLEWIAIKTESDWQLFQEPEDQEIGIPITGANLEYSRPYRIPNGSVRLSMPRLASVTIHPPGKNLKKEDLSV